MFDVMALIVVGTSVAVLIDASQLGIKKGQIAGFFNMGPLGWFLSCLLLWIVAFPAYLVKRGEYKRAIDGPARTGRDALASVEKLADLKRQGILSEEEYQEKKQELLNRV